MASAHKAILLPIVSTFSSKGIRDAQGALGGLGKSMKGAALAGVGFAAALAAIDFAGGAITQARDLERNVAGLKTVFGDAAKEMQTFAQGANNFGLSTSSAAKASTFLGTVLKSAGFDMQTTQDETKKLTALASDLAATYGYDVQEALTGMTALFRGEYDPIEKFGVAMKQSEINAILAANGQDKLKGAARRNAEQQIRLQLLYERTTDAQGAFERQSGSLFVEQMKLTASFEDMQAEVGGALTPTLATLMQTLTPLLEKITPGLTALFTMFGDIIEYITPLFEPLAEVLDYVFVIVAQVGDAFGPLIERLMLFGRDILDGIVVPALKFVFQIMEGLGPIITLLLSPLNLLMDVLTGIGRLVAWFFEPLLRGLGTLFQDYIKPLIDGLNTFLGLNRKVKTEMVGYSSITINPATGKPFNAKVKRKKKKPDPDTTDDKGESDAERRARKERERIAAQKKAYQDLAKSIQEAFKSIQDSIMSAFDITQMGTRSKSLLSNVRRLITQTKKFAESLRGLASQGLNPQLLQQLINAGPVDGGRLAADLLKTGSVGALNSAYAEFGAIANDIATTGATSQFMNPSQDQYQIYVNAGIGDKNTIGKAIVEAIATYEKQSGAAWRK
jgi:hypothetical protein